MKTCAICPTELNKNQSKFCSRACQGLSKRLVGVERTKICEVCEAVFAKGKRSAKNWSNATTCSNRCRYLRNNNSSEIELYCWNCNEYIDRNTHGIQRKQSEKFCKRKCFDEFIKKPGGWSKIRGNSSKRKIKHQLSKHQMAAILAVKSKAVPAESISKQANVTLTYLSKKRYVKLFESKWTICQRGAKAKLRITPEITRMSLIIYGVMPKRKFLTKS